MATSYSVKIGEIGLFTFIRRPAISYSDFYGSSTIIWLHRINIWWTSVQ